jgi:hypothetical protein
MANQFFKEVVQVVDGSVSTANISVSIPLESGNSGSTRHRGQYQTQLFVTIAGTPAGAVVNIKQPVPNFAGTGFDNNNIVSLGGASIGISTNATCSKEVQLSVSGITATTALRVTVIAMRPPLG